MKKYEYPSELTEENFGKLVERAKAINSASSRTLTVAIFASLALFLGIAVLFILSYRHDFISIQNAQMFAWISLAIATGSSLFLSFFVIERINIVIRRFFHLLIPFYPGAEEFIFAQCILTANLYTKKSNWAARVRYRAMALSEEFSRFPMFDVLNFRRKFYARECGLLANGETQIGRMLLFSEGKIKELFSNFALNFVNENDSISFEYLKRIIKEVESYGKLEGLSQRIEHRIRSWKGIIALIGAIVAIAATIVGLFLKG